MCSTGTPKHSASWAPTSCIPVGPTVAASPLKVPAIQGLPLGSTMPLVPCPHCQPAQTAQDTSLGAEPRTEADF